MGYDDLELKIKSLLRKYKVRCRYINQEDSKVILGIESTKSNNLPLFKKISSLGLRPTNIVYGRWVFTNIKSL